MNGKTMLPSLLHRGSVIGGVAVLMGFLSLQAAEEDDVQFKPKTYVPGKSGTFKSCPATPYRPSEKSASRSIGPVYDAKGKEASRDAFSPATRELDAPALKPSDPVPARAYTHTDQQTFVATMTPDPAVAAEQKPFESKSGKLRADPFTPAERPHEKNPLLRPRQDIKESGE